jgi:hypothetical protein
VTPTETRTALAVQRRRQPRPTELNPPLGREEEPARVEHALDNVRQYGGGNTLFVQGAASSSEVLLSLRGKKMYSAVTNTESIRSGEYTAGEYTRDKRSHRTRR